MVMSRSVTRLLVSTLMLISLLIIIAAFIEHRLTRSEFEICEGVGEVINGDELIDKALLSFVYKFSTLFSKKARTFGDAGVRLGIIRDVEADSLNAKLLTAPGDIGGLEQSLSIERIEHEDIKGADERFFKELVALSSPFAFVVYRGDATLTRGVVYFSNEFERVELKEVLSGDYIPSVYERYMGYGNYYFRARYKSFSLECCSGNKRSHKYEGLAPSLREDETKLSETLRDYKVLAVSNCGEVLDESSESHRLYREIKWIIGG